HGGGVEVGQAALVAGLRDEDGGGLAGGGGGGKALHKVDLGAKAAGGVGVGLLQGVVLLHRSDQHDLHFHIHGLGQQRGGGAGGVGRGAATASSTFFDLQAAAAQKAAQARPQAFFGHHVLQVQQDEAAVRLEQAAGQD